VGANTVWVNRWDAWKSRASLKHGRKYRYPSPERQRAGDRWKITIECPEHGEFTQDPQKHLAGQGCPKCKPGLISIARTPDWGAWKYKASSVHCGKYEYLSRTKVRGRFVVEIECPVHGLFTQDAAKHTGGQGCPKCAYRDLDKRGQLEKRFPAFDWSHVSPEIGSRDELLVLCPEHGKTTSTFNRLMQRKESLSACSKCSVEARGAASRVSAEEWKRRISLTHDGLTVDADSVSTCQEKARVTCSKHGEFFARPNDLVNGHGCPTCACGRTSSGENDMAEFIQQCGFEVKRGNRSLLGGYELDIYVADARLAIEYCGNYWHGEKFKKSSYHQKKMDAANSVGLRLLTVFEDEWVFMRNKVEERVRQALGIVTKVWARNTTVRDVGWGVARQFLDQHHMQGCGIAPSRSLGLFIGDQLLSVMTFGKHRYGFDGVEMYRFCTAPGISVVGGLSKLIAHYAKSSAAKSLHTYADLRWGTGEGYRVAGFMPRGRTKPGYFWCRGLDRITRVRFQKHRLADVLENFNNDLSEAENCHANGYWRIYDCGMSSWSMNLG